GHPVARPTRATADGVEGWPFLAGAHEPDPAAEPSAPALLPHMTSPPPRLISSIPTPVRPAARQAAACASRGDRRQRAAMHGPAERPTCHQARPPVMPPSTGRASRV